MAHAHPSLSYLLSFRAEKPGTAGRSRRRRPRSRRRPTPIRRPSRTLGARLARSDRVIWDGVAALRALLAREWRVVIATASEHELAAAYLRGIGLHAVELIASRIDPTTGRFHVHNHGTEKPRQLELAGIGTGWTVAYTDSLNDLPLLQRATRPILVNPNRKLVRRTTDRLGTTPDIVSWNGAALHD
ncbi:haloacid dehalogenase-like hydrolase [Saccharopolyspora erythraea]|uniref:haloacid dehalogenase-like hydrolase n=1 Tax=Saccharopolyspora erythraea TaxID=1836 RepID=UPI001BA6485D|nr:haloacid dehalogenase-like hydrolase [Saccharopolyspora erythraea]QUH01894.1 haloacid dehalogenase-like hydrolase [Saccharopolyspora erythraea]